MAQAQKRNTVYLLLVEACWGLGMNLVSMGTVIPVFLAHAGATNKVISLLPALSALAAGIAQVFSSYLTHRSKSIKGWVLALHVLVPTPFAFIGLGLWGGWGSPVWLVLIGWAFYYGFIGLVFPIWLDYMARILDPTTRGRTFGLVFLAQTLCGALGVTASSWMLERSTSNGQYALLFGLAWAVLALGSLLFLGTREEAAQEAPEGVSLFQHFRNLAGLLKRFRWMRMYLTARWFVRGTYPLLIHFYAVYAVSSRGVSAAEAALYGTAALVAQAGASLALGYLGDRAGHKLSVLIGQAALVLACLLVLLPLPGAAFFVVAALTGVYLSTEFTSQNNWLMDLSNAEVRQSLIALTGFLLTPAAVLAPFAGGWIMDYVGFPAVSAGIAVALLIAMALEVVFVPSGAEQGPLSCRQ